MKNRRLTEENSNKVKNIFRDLPSLEDHITDSYVREVFESIVGIIIISTISINKYRKTGPDSSNPLSHKYWMTKSHLV